MSELNQYNFATWVRATGVILILLCHFTQESSNVYFNMSAQFFNIGVSLFFILSGFLFGIKRGGVDNPVDWYKRRIKRIYIPYECFVIILMVIHIISGRNIVSFKWVFLFLGVQGSAVDILGAGHTWFISALLICYLFTPIIDKLLNRIDNCDFAIIIFIGVAAVLPMVLALVPVAFVYVLFSPVCFYSLSYLLGKRFDRVKITFKSSLILVGVALLSFAVRIASKVAMDGTILYNRIIANYTQTIAAFCLFYIFAYLFKNIKPLKIVAFISEISFEIYLYHYMFTVGPVSLFQKTSNWFLGCLLVTFTTVCIAWTMNRFVKLIDNILRSGVKK